MRLKMKKVIGIIGEQAGGKGAASTIIIKKYGGTRLTTSNILRRTLDSINIPVSRENLITLALLIKKGFGKDVLMRAMLKEVENEDSNIVIVDGIRMPGDTDPFIEEYGGDFKLIYVTADKKIRYERSLKRGEKAGESEASYEEFISKEKSETEKYISRVGKTADFKIVNNKDQDDLEEKIITIMEKI
jgi:dephospho-CoA kinase